MKGGKYLAEDRGAFQPEAPEPDIVIPISPVEAARAPLFEIAATHDGQPPTDWLRVFMQCFKSGAVA